MAASQPRAGPVVGVRKVGRLRRSPRCFLWVWSERWGGCVAAPGQILWPGPGRWGGCVAAPAASCGSVQKGGAAASQPRALPVARPRKVGRLRRSPVHFLWPGPERWGVCVAAPGRSCGPAQEGGASASQPRADPVARPRKVGCLRRSPGHFPWPGPGRWGVCGAAPGRSCGPAQKGAVSASQPPGTSCGPAQKGGVSAAQPRADPVARPRKVGRLRRSPGQILWPGPERCGVCVAAPGTSCGPAQEGGVSAAQPPLLPVVRA